MKEIFAYVREVMVTLAKMQNNSTLMRKTFEIGGWSILKVIDKIFIQYASFCISGFLAQ